MAESAPMNFSTLANNCHPQWWRDPGLRKLNMTCIIILLSPVMIGFDGSLISGLLAIPQWLKDLGMPDENLLGLLIAAQSFGGLIGFLPASYSMDKFGRRLMIVIGDIFIIASAIGQIFCKSATSYLVTRLFIGIGVVLALCSGPVLLTELAHPRQRGNIVSFFGVYFYIGAIVAAWVTFGTLNIKSSWSWRLPTALQVVPAITQAILLILVPESPRWLISKGRNEEAKHILAKYHANGHEDDPLVIFEFEEIKDTMRREQDSDNFGWLGFSKTSANRKRLFLIIALAVFSQWSGNSIVSYYFVPVLKSVGITSNAQQAAINGGLAIFNFVISGSAASLCDRVGRRKLWLSSTCVMLASMVIVTIAASQFASTGNAGAGRAVIVFLFVFNFGYSIGYSPLVTMYTAEICSYSMRSKGLSLSFMTALTAGLFNQYVNPRGLAKLGWKYYLVFVVVLIIELIVTYFFYPETKGFTVEEVAVLFEGKDSNVVPHTTVQEIEAKEAIAHVEAAC